MHISYSQYSTYKKCPRSWYLGKVIGAPERPAWYTIIGTVTHLAIEDHLDGHVLGVQSVKQEFNRRVMKAREAEPDTDQWMFSMDGDGNPLVKERAFEHVRVCFERAVEFLEDIDVWEVEYDASGHLPGCDPEVKAFIDVIGEHKKHGPVIVDWKTGKSKDRFQLDTYTSLLESNNGEYQNLNFKGYFAMLAPWAPQSRFTDLSDVVPAEVGAKYQKVYNQMKARLYKTTHAEAVCGFCFQRHNCLVRSEDTERATYYDRSAEDGLPF